MFFYLRKLPYNFLSLPLSLLRPPACPLLPPQGSLLFIRVAERTEGVSSEGEGKKGALSPSKSWVSRIWQGALRL